jgi:hypothetical protein
LLSFPTDCPKEVLMKAHRKRIRLLKSLAIAGCTIGLAVPTMAAAMPADGPISRAVAQQTIYHPHGRPASAPAYVPPATFKTDTQSEGGVVGQRTFVLPSNHKGDVPSATPAATPSTPSPVVREIRTVTRDGSHTLAIVLAAAALGIALCGTGLALGRLAQIQRRVLGSSS